MTIEINRLMLFVGVCRIRSDCLVMSEILHRNHFKEVVYIFIFLDKFIYILIY